MPKLPLAVQALDVDRLVAETRAQFEAIVKGDEVPSFEVPDIVPEPSPYSPASNFFRTWEKDEAGRWVYVGLNQQETQELMAHEGFRLNGDDLEVVEAAKDRDRLEYFNELIERRETARFGAIWKD